MHSGRRRSIVIAANLILLHFSLVLCPVLLISGVPFQLRFAMSILTLSTAEGTLATKVLIAQLSFLEVWHFPQFMCSVGKGAPTFLNTTTLNLLPLTFRKAGHILVLKYVVFLFCSSNLELNSLLFTNLASTYFCLDHYGRHSFPIDDFVEKHLDDLFALFLCLDFEIYLLIFWCW